MGTRRSKGRALTVGVLLLATIGVILALINVSKSDKSVLQVGQPAPDFTLTDLEDKSLSLSDLKGKAVILNFWASWCTPCRQEMPALQDVYQSWKDKGVIVLGVNIGESKVTANGFMNRVGATFPSVLDPDRNVTLNLYKVGPIPSTFFIDKNGIIRHIYTGQMNYGYIEEQVKVLLGQ